MRTRSFTGMHAQKAKLDSNYIEDLNGLTCQKSVNGGVEPTSQGLPVPVIQHFVQTTDAKRLNTTDLATGKQAYIIDMDRSVS